ncbi:putative pollen-specific leucine-rich repeat extensin-like protein 3 [Iris pallida]|uniref:Pollen-specific leucine-rich repeat extensin-like protein 3 n=1 Tax=Iris pallida TaxID=29817 RepID=A0AAX6HLL1_IRIPA|nr:putative pollen-specific leucine-rich repeat extensin-like protein 3 [Iris pallida]
MVVFQIWYGQIWWLDRYEGRQPEAWVDSGKAGS